MKHIFLTLFSLGALLTSCREQQDTKPLSSSILAETLLEIPNTIIDHADLCYDNKTSLWTLNDQLYSGYAVSYYQDSVLKEKSGILEGKKQNQAIQWYPDGHYKQVANYHRGKLHGEKKMIRKLLDSFDFF